MNAGFEIHVRRSAAESATVFRVQTIPRIGETVFIDGERFTVVDVVHKLVTAENTRLGNYIEIEVAAE